MITEADFAWLKGEIEHCRRMEYTAEAQRFERIYAALVTAVTPVSISGGQTPNPCFYGRIQMTELRDKIARIICSAAGGGVCDCPGSTGYEEDADRILAIPEIAGRWQPIETAPKDGRPLLLLSPEGYVGFGRMVTERQIDEQEWVREDACWIGQRPHDRRASFWMCGRSPSEATHWAAVPEPPSKAETVKPLNLG